MLNLKYKPLKLIIVFSIVLVLSTPILFVQPVVAQTQTTENIDKSFAWDYDGRHWTWNLSIPRALYDEYHSVPDARRTRDGPAGYGFLTTTEDYYVNMLADKLNASAQSLGYGSYDKVSFVLAFVQSLPYTSDNVTTGNDEYPRFPIETLVDDGGDCEDTSILFASLTLIMGYGTIYINPPNHYAVGVLGNNLHGTYWTYPSDSNKTYYYCETTGNGFKIGQLPTEFQGQTAYIYPIDESKQFVPDLVVMPTVEPTPTNWPVTSSSTPPPQTPKNTASPDVTDPTVQPVMPLSLNLVSENPFLFILIVFAIVVSLVLAVWSVRRPKHPSIPEPPHASYVSEPAEPSTSETDRFCIYCGSSNKGYAVFCEKCGKQIS